MGKSMFCDLCRKNVAIEEALKPVSIGENVICEVCLDCESQIATGLKQQISKNVAELIAAQRAAAQPAPQPEAPKPQPTKPAEQPTAGIKVENTLKGKRPGE